MSDQNTQDPRVREPVRRRSLVPGLLGAALGALLTMAAAVALWELLRPAGGQAGGVFLWLMAMTAPGSCLGYRLFRGRRSRRAALAAVIPATMLACLLAVPAMLLYSLWRKAAGEVPLSLLLESMDWGELRETVLVRGWPLSALCAAMGALGLLVFRGIVLDYADRETAPWRAAYAGGNGAMYNFPPRALPAGKLPRTFRVGGKLEVDGEELRTLPLLGRGKRFRAGDIAGAVMGPAGGCNVLYDRECRILSKFAWSMYGADLLAAYLLERNIPIRSPEALAPLFRREAPPETAVPEKFALALPPQAVRDRHRIGTAFLVLAALLLGAVLFLRRAVPLPGVLCAALACGCLCVGVIGWVFLRVTGNHRLEVDGETLRYVSPLGRRRSFTAGDIRSASWHGGYYELQDGNWRSLARLSPGLEHMELLRPYMEKHCPEMQIRESPTGRRQ